MVASYRAAREAGVTDAEFWASTPYLTRLAVEAASERVKDGYRRALIAAYHVALWQRSKRMPPLRRVLKGLEPRRGPPRRMSPADMLKQIELWNAAFGGRDNRRPPPVHAH